MQIDLSKILSTPEPPKQQDLPTIEDQYRALHAEVTRRQLKGEINGFQALKEHKELDEEERKELARKRVKLAKPSGGFTFQFSRR